MFFQAVPGSNAGISRPFIVGLVMLLLFLSMQVRPLIQSAKLFGEAHLVDWPRLWCRLPDCCAASRVFCTTRLHATARGWSGSKAV